MDEVLGAFAGRHHLGVVRDLGAVKRGSQRRQMKPGDGRVGDDDDAPLRQHRQHVRSGVTEQPGADQDLVAAVAERDGQPFDRTVSVAAHGTAAAGSATCSSA